MKKSRPKRRLLPLLLESEPTKACPEDTAQEPKLQPALRQLGISDCPICKHEVAVFLTKNSRPFINCSFCSARIFYNGRESMRRLGKKMRPVEDE